MLLWVLGYRGGEIWDFFVILCLYSFYLDIMKQILQILELVDSADAVAAYRKAHDEIWPEIKVGIREVGITRMDIFLHDHTVVMIVEHPDSVNFDSAMQRLALLPRQQEWEEFVAKWQQCDPESTSAGKWKRMEQIFTL